MSLTKKQTKIISYIFFGVGFVIFIPFLDMTIRANLSSDDVPLSLFASVHVFFFTNWLFIHAPAFALIIFGAYFLRKSKNMTIN